LPTAGTLDDPDYRPLPFDPDQAQEFKVFIKGNKLARIGPLYSEVYDLDRGVVEYWDGDKRRYSSKPFAEKQREIDHSTAYDKHVHLAIEPTGNTEQVGNERADEFRITAFIGKEQSARPIARALYLIVARLPSQEAESFRDRCLKIYPEYAGVCSLAQSKGFGVIAKDAELLPGYPVVKVMDAQTVISGPAGPDSWMADASGRSDPRPGEEAGGPFPRQTSTFPSFTRLRRAEAKITNFVEGPIDDSIFDIRPHHR
jgi:hypothetical protein